MNIAQVTKKLLINDPFYGFILMNINKRFDDSVPTACVTIEGINYELLINKEFWDTLNDDAQYQVFKHEVLHLCFFHLDLQTDFSDKRLFNIAADAEVNQYLDIDKLPRGCVNILKMYPGIKEKAGVKFYYEYLKENGGEDFLPQVNNHELWKRFEELNEAEKELVKNQVDRLLSNATEAVQKSRGTVPGELEEYIKKLLRKTTPVFNWKAYFRRLLGTAEEYYLKSTRKKPSKRFKDSPGLKHKHLQNILVGIDTSGSVNNKELAEFFEEIHFIIKAGVKVDVCECDTDINRVYDFKTWDGNISGRGGTEFKPVVDYFNKSKKDYSALVYFTDGYCPLEGVKPLKPMIWVITSDGNKQDYPGKVVYIPKKEENNE